VLGARCRERGASHFAKGSGFNRVDEAARRRMIENFFAYVSRNPYF
jgi:hypothetical protein